VKTVARRSAGPAVQPSRPALLQRQCSCGTHTAGGGECSECARKHGTLQRRLVIGEANGALERDADRLASHALATPQAEASASPRSRAELGANRSRTADASAPLLQSSGSPLDASLRGDMERRFGHDFSGVRIHTGADAAHSAESVNADAFAVGRDVVFGSGRYQPRHDDGRHLLAHELAHVVQQDSGTAPPSVQRQERRPRPAPVDADAQRIIDMAQDTTTPMDRRAPAIVQAIIDQYFPGDAAKVTAINYRADEPGLKVDYQGTGTATTGTLDVGNSFVENTTQRHFARRVLQVRHEIEHIDQVRSGMGGEGRSDEREFIAHYHGAVAEPLPGTGAIQHSTRVQMIDGALGYYYCLDADLQSANSPKRDELVTRRAEAVRRSNRTDLGEAPRTCTRPPGDTGPRRGRRASASGGGGLSGWAIAGIVGGVAAAGVGIAALAGAFS
jgi:hypothetical protein